MPGSNFTQKKTLVFHHILFAILPVLTLYAINANKLLFTHILWVMVLVVAATLLMSIVANRILKDVQKSAIIVSGFLILFFSFGHVIAIITNISHLVNQYAIVRFFVETSIGLTIWLSLWLLIWIGLIFWVLRTKSDLNNPTFLLNVISFGLVVSVFISNSNFARQSVITDTPVSDQASQHWLQDRYTEEQPLSSKTTYLPNIYFIILDAFGRQDMISKWYGLDLNDFVSFLEEKGFYVAGKSHSNYVTTTLSLSATLNFSYLDDYARYAGTQSSDLTPMQYLIAGNRTVAQLHSLGYRFVSFSTGYPYTEIKTADLYLGPTFNLNSFSSTLIDSTPLFPFLLDTQYDYARERILYTFDHLGDTAISSKPSFVFAHILSPHPPFIFDDKGQPTNPPRAYSNNDGSDFFQLGTRQEYIQGYRNQVLFASSRIRQTIEQILQNSPQPPIIIIEGDHGSGLNLDQHDLAKTDVQDRFSNLIAIYMPGMNSKMLYPDISSVNTFRVIFDNYFGTNYKLLDDRSYYSTLDHPYKLVDITDRLEGAK